MNSIIIGTAGHIDHGKTTLIKALTGSDTDRLKEEKKRGISIDLGFTSFQINQNKKVGIVDVPGHEKFLKNMLAGVAGMDLVLLVVSAEEGIMPQTREHLDILNLIGLQKGIVVISKISKVDADFLEIVEEDLKIHLKGTFLETAPIVGVDSITKQGIPELIQKIDKLTDEFEPKNLKAIPRLFVDRVFSIKGFGTVVTGTLIEGTLAIDQEIFVYPQGIATRVRGLQVHSDNEEVAFAGQRVAVNLSNITLNQLKRGDILYGKKGLPASMMIDAKIKLLKNASKDLEHWDRIRLYHGAREIIGRAVPLEGTNLEKGQEGYVQIRLEESIVANPKDKIIIRLYSPMETIGGGYIIDPNPKKHTSNTENISEYLLKKESGNILKKVEYFLLEKHIPVDELTVRKHFDISTDDFLEIMNNLMEDQIVIPINHQYIHCSNLENLKNKIIENLKKYHEQNKFKLGMNKEELRNKVEKNIKPKEFEGVLQYFIGSENIKVEKNMVSLKEFKIIYDHQSEKIKQEIQAYYKNNMMPVQTSQFVNSSKIKEDILNSLIGTELIKINDEIIYSEEVYQNLLNEVLEYLEKNKQISVKEFKEFCGLSRKYLIAFLEHLDANKITKRQGDYRIKF